jgi:hypothetical protein
VSAAPAGGPVSRGLGVALALLRLDIGALGRLDGGVEEARRSVRAVLFALPLYFLALILAGGLELAMLGRLSLLAVEASTVFIMAFATPVIVSLVAPAYGRAHRVPLFITAYNYLSVLSVLVLLGAVLLARLSEETTGLALLLNGGYWLWSFVVLTVASRAILEIAWQSAILVTLVDAIVGQLVVAWSDALVQAILQP